MPLIIDFGDELELKMRVTNVYQATDLPADNFTLTIDQEFSEIPLDSVKECTSLLLL
jgi:hypothetical protein